MRIYISAYIHRIYLIWNLQIFAIIRYICKYLLFIHKIRIYLHYTRKKVMCNNAHNYVDNCHHYTNIALTVYNICLVHLSTQLWAAQFTDFVHSQCNIKSVQIFADISTNCKYLQISYYEYLHYVKCNATHYSYECISIIFV